MITLAGEEGLMDKQPFPFGCLCGCLRVVQSAEQSTEAFRTTFPHFVSSDSLFNQYSCFLVCFPLQTSSSCYWAFMVRECKTLFLNKDKKPRQRGTNLHTYFI